MSNAPKSWMRGLVEFALNRDLDVEIEQQRRILQVNPRSPKAHYDLGLLYYSQGRISEAISEYEAAIESEPLFGGAYRKLGEIQVSLGNYERAAQYARKAATLGDTALLDMFERYPVGDSNDSSADDRLQQQQSSEGGVAFPLTE